MGKKQRRKQSRKATRQPIQAAGAGSPASPTRQPPAGAAPTGAPRAAESQRRQKTVATWAEHAQRYEYVNRELKSIGILAGSFLVVLLILSAVIG